jgi:hypothetical protein
MVLFAVGLVHLISLSTTARRHLPTSQGKMKVLRVPAFPPPLRYYSCSLIVVDSRAAMCELFTHTYDFLESKRTGGAPNPLGAG